VSEILKIIRKLVAAREVRISEHGFDELSDDRISVRDAVRGINDSPDPLQWDVGFTRRRK
jgi:hypothetical protein